MTKEKYFKNITIRYSETEQNLALKPYALLNFLQDVASQNACDLNFGYDFLYPKNLAWFLLKYRMEFYEYPFDIGQLKVTTDPRGYNKLFAYRNFEMIKNDKIIAKMSSIWGMVDFKKRSMVPIDPILKDCQFMNNYHKMPDDLEYSKIIYQGEDDKKEDFKVRYNDLDVNGHANNGNYIVWAFEPLDYDFRNTHKIKTLDMVFKKEARYNDVITSKLQIKDNTTLHKLVNQNNEEVCLVQSIWEKI